MIDHVGFVVSASGRTRPFSEQALAPLGISLVMSVTPEQAKSGAAAHGFGSDGTAYFWIGDNEKVGEGPDVAFAFATRAEVDAFYAAALAAGGRDNGGPCIRPHYHPNFHAAFVYDPDGDNIEAVCHRPE